ncbi:MAG: InlB B-repeat-containing protein [bacterium JZ-2024 1]
MRFFRIFAWREGVVIFLGLVAFVSFLSLLFSLTASVRRGGAPPSLTFTLTVNKTGTGTGTVTSNPSGISCGNTCSALFSSGSTVTLFITPDPGSSFAGWSGDCTGNSPQIQVTMNANKTCTATFHLIKVWARTYGWADGDWAGFIQQTSDGGYIVAGDTYSFGAGSRDIWVLKLDANGNVLWQKTYGGANWDGADSIQQTSDGGYIVAGSTYSFGAGYRDIWVLKLDANGNVLWQKTYGGGNWDRAYSIQQTSDGGYIVAGDTYSFGAGSSDIWVLKLDANGNIHGCTPANFVGTSYATPAVSSASPQNTSATPSFSSATTTNTNAAINNTNGSTKVQCTG